MWIFTITDFLSSRGRYPLLLPYRIDIWISPNFKGPCRGLLAMLFVNRFLQAVYWLWGDYYRVLKDDYHVPFADLHRIKIIIRIRISLPCYYISVAYLCEHPELTAYLISSGDELSVLKFYLYSIYSLIAYLKDCIALRRKKLLNQ